jgi:hypothetical protein
VIIKKNCKSFSKVIYKPNSGKEVINLIKTNDNIKNKNENEIKNKMDYNKLDKKIQMN